MRALLKCIIVDPVSDSDVLDYLNPTVMAKHLSSKQDYASLFEKYDTWLFDCDGVLWHGMKVLDGVLDVLHHLRASGESSVIIVRYSLDT